MKRIVPLILLPFLLIGCINNQHKNVEEYKIELAIEELKERYGKTENPRVEIISNIEELKKTKKAIYNDANNGMLQLTWPDLLIIYDIDNNKIIKELPISNLKID
ncbi:MAG: hypothetical protein N3D73_02965 [Candidatus Diapherotrites archaeon]|nr:hypothetical protein [Candidatus Diapherotrites archaeon]